MNNIVSNIAHERKSLGIVVSGEIKKLKGFTLFDNIVHSKNDYRQNVFFNDKKFKTKKDTLSIVANL